MTVITLKVNSLRIKIKAQNFSSLDLMLRKTRLKNLQKRGSDFFFYHGSTKVRLSNFHLQKKKEKK